MDFVKFPKIPRLNREIIITEKIDGTQGQIIIDEHGGFAVGSKNRFVTRDDDNFGFAAWAYDHRDELEGLGPGRHFGEWWGYKIGRGYDMKERIFSLFNTKRWSDSDARPSCCSVVPVLDIYSQFDSVGVSITMARLQEEGSSAAPGFMRPEGVVVYHAQGNVMFKATLEGDDRGKAWGA
jgi:hypothetical protein